MLRPAIEKIYHRYLDDGNSAALVRSVSERYTFATLARLAEFGDYLTRRASVLAVSYLGDYPQTAILGRALRDRDRGVRMIADNGIRQLWRRDGNIRQRELLAALCRLNHNELYEEAIEAAGALIDEAAWIAEAWNQRGIALFALQDFEASANDCHQTLELNSYHFGAAVGIAHCYLEMNDPFAALESFRRALRLNPDLEDVRVQIDYLQRALKGK
jgi:tetratricopeptide (TPR) repeat protein